MCLCVCVCFFFLGGSEMGELGFRVLGFRVFRWCRISESLGFAEF